MAIEWGILVLHWAVDRTADTLLDTLGKPFRRDPMVEDLTAAVQTWVNSLPPHVQTASPEPIFPSRLSDSDLEERPRLLTIRATLRRKEIPSQEMWTDALLEQWDFINRTVDAPYGIFALSRPAAREHLESLARELAFVCATDAESFKRFVYSQFEHSTKKRGGVLQLLSEGSEYYIPDSDDNRNIVKGATPNTWSYAVVRMSWVLEAYSDWEIHGCRIWLLDGRQWRAVTLFDPAEQTWPLTGALVRNYLSQQAQAVARSPVSTNLTRFDLLAGKSKQLRLTGYVMTPTSLSREAHYPLLMLWHIKTSYAAFLLRLHEVYDPDLLGHTLFDTDAGSIEETAQEWAESTLRAFAADPVLAASQPRTITLRGP